MPAIPDYTDEELFQLDNAPTTSAAVQAAPAAQTPTPAPILPAARPTPAPKDENPLGDLDKGLAQAIKDYQNALGLQASMKDQEKPTIVSTAPNWFKGGPPPHQNAWASNLFGALGNSLSAGDQIAMKEPLRTLGNKMRDARHMGAVQGLTGLLQGITNRGADEYNRNLDAAAKEAAMTKTLPGGSRSAQLVANNKALMDTYLHLKQLQSVDELRKHNISQDEMNNSTDENAVPQLAAARRVVAQTFANRGMPVPDLSQTSLKSLERQYGIFNTAMGTESRENVAQANAENARANIAEHANQQLRVKGEEQAADEQKLRDEFKGIDSNMVFVGPVPRDAAARNEIRTAAADMKTTNDALNKMKAIQDRLNEIGHGMMGPIDEWLPNNPEAQQLVNTAKQLQQELTIKERSRAHMGVPQEWEQKLVKSLFPAAGSIQAWLKGGPAWEAAQQVINNHYRSFLRNHNVGFLDEGAKPAAPYNPNYNQVPVAPVTSARQLRGAAPVGGGGGGGELSLPPGVEQAIQAREVAPLPKVNDVIGKPPPKVEKGVAPKPGSPNALIEKYQNVLKAAEGKVLTPEQQKRVDGIKKLLADLLKQGVK